MIQHRELDAGAVRVDAVGDLLGCLVKGDLDGFLAAMTPDVDCALHASHKQAWILQAKGREAVREMVIELRRDDGPDVRHRRRRRAGR